MSLLSLRFQHVLLCVQIWKEGIASVHWQIETQLYYLCRDAAYATDQILDDLLSQGWQEGGLQGKRNVLKCPRTTDSLETMLKCPLSCLYWFIDRMVCNHMEPFRLFSISIRVELICQAVIIVDTFWLVIKRWVKETASDYTTRSVHWCFFFNSKQHWNVFNSLLKHHWFTCLFLLQSTSQQVPSSHPLSIKCFPQLSQQLKTTKQTVWQLTISLNKCMFAQINGEIVSVSMKMIY